jgi:hypothetical protein
MTPENRENISKLVDILEGLDERQCYMAEWYTTNRSFGLPAPADRGKPGCGTTACLAGWAALCLAPTESAESSHYMEVNARWAQKHGIEFAPDSHRITYDTLPPNARVTADVPTIGTALLGEEATRLFTLVHGPEAMGISDREWMIWALLGLLEGRDPVKKTLDAIVVWQEEEDKKEWEEQEVEP